MAFSQSMSQSMSQTQVPSNSISFSQLEPEDSQAPPDARPYEKSNLERLNADTQSQLVTKLSRLLLFKSLTGEPIDRTKLAKEAFPDTLKEKIVNAALEEACNRMRNVIGLDVRRPPDSILQNKSMPSKYKERLFVVNRILDDRQGTHSRALHASHLDASIEKGLLMLVLAFIYCKGEIREHTRWITASTLYRLLHSVDENIPSEPDRSKSGTAPGKRESFAINNSIMSPSADAASTSTSGVGLTPNVDILLEKYVYMDYLAKKKPDGFDNVVSGSGSTQEDEGFLYAMGPRALLEVGRKQIICFCAQVLDQEPDPTMLQELNQENDGS